MVFDGQRWRFGCRRDVNKGKEMEGGVLFSTGEKKGGGGLWEMNTCLKWRIGGFMYCGYCCLGKKEK